MIDDPWGLSYTYYLKLNYYVVFPEINVSSGVRMIFPKYGATLFYASP